jgi:hypothetical protein
MMNREQLIEMHLRMSEDSRALMRKKNADYAGEKSQDPFANFTRCEHMGISSTEAGILTRMCDKLSRLSSFVEAGELSVKEESIRDTCLDMINYSILFYAYLVSSGKISVPVNRAAVFKNCRDISCNKNSNNSSIFLRD